MKRETLLTIAVIVLLLLNLGTLGFLLLHHPRGPMGPMAGHPPGGMPPGGVPAGMQAPIDRQIIEFLHLSPQQQIAFDTLKREHHRAMMRLDSNYAATLSQYLMLLRSNAGMSGKDSIERKLAAIQVQKASITLEHFQKLKGITLPAQRAAFDSLVPKLTAVILRPSPMPPPGMGPGGPGMPPHGPLGGPMGGHGYREDQRGRDFVPRPDFQPHE